METQVFSAYSHVFGGNSKEIHYYESKYVKGPNNHVICIDSAEPESHGALFNKYIGKTFQPEYRIELWATKTYDKRKEQDKNRLQMEKQIIHFCDGTIKVVVL